MYLKAYHKKLKLFNYIFVLLIVTFCLYGCNSKNVSTEVPNITGKLLNGDSVNLREIAKGKFTLVNVWGIFCGPCIKELSILHRVYNNHKNRKDFAFITIAMDSESELNRFLNPADTSDYRKMFVYSKLKSFSLPTLSCLPNGYSYENGGYAIIQDSLECRTIGQMINSSAIPATLIYDPKGNLVFKQSGSFDDDQLLIQKVDSLLSL